MRNSPRSLLSLLLVWTAGGLWLSPAALAAAIDWVTVGDPGNACDRTLHGCFGAVAEVFRISTTEVTNAQYAEFLNAKALSDPLGLYDERMSSRSGGIRRSGGPGSFSYTPIIGRGGWPVNFVTFYDAVRFANWLHNGQGDGDTETGAYTLVGGTETPSNGESVTRNARAKVFLPSEDEWYKAAYYDTASATYSTYPTGSVAECAAPGAKPKTANCLQRAGGLTNVRSYTMSASANGTFDQGGNVSEWNEAVILGNRGLRGGSFNLPPLHLGKASRSGEWPSYGHFAVGFRVASVPK